MMSSVLHHWAYRFDFDVLSAFGAQVADTPSEFRTNGVEATGFRDCGILAFLSCSPEAIIVGDTNTKGGSITGGSALPLAH